MHTQSAVCRNNSAEVNSTYVALALKQRILSWRLRDWLKQVGTHGIRYCWCTQKRSIRAQEQVSKELNNQSRTWLTEWLTDTQTYWPTSYKHTWHTYMTYIHDIHDLLLCAGIRLNSLTVLWLYVYLMSERNWVIMRKHACTSVFTHAWTYLCIYV